MNTCLLDMVPNGGLELALAAAGNKVPNLSFVELHLAYQILLDFKHSLTDVNVS